jgi:hypothetical protein
VPRVASALQVSRARGWMAGRRSISIIGSGRSEAFRPIAVDRGPVSAGKVGPFDGNATGTCRIRRPPLLSGHVMAALETGPRHAWRRCCARFVPDLGLGRRVRDNWREAARSAMGASPRSEHQFAEAARATQNSPASMGARRL